MARPFVDEVEVIVQGGSGGDGCTAFERQPYNARGGPSGGDGGDGGSLFFKASSRKNTLSDFNHRKLLKAEDGTRGGPDRKKGQSGDDLVLKVPPGTIIYEASSNKLLGELLEAGDQLLIARGGDGGRGNRCFTTSRRQAPHFHELGAAGEHKKIRLELKLVADIGLIGYPNSGKSTLLDSLTGAHPEIASYPFTTINPNLGVLEKGFERMTICDIPGLVNNAHAGAGLGIKFLRHIARTTILVQLVDISAPTPVDDFKAIRHELKKYNPELLKKPTIIVCNKLDLVEPQEVDIFAEDISPAPGPVIGISAQTGENLKTLVESLWEIYNRSSDSQEPQPEDDQIRIVRLPAETPLEVIKQDDRFILRGDRVKELVNRFDLNNRDALSYVRQQLLEIGLHKKLEKAGCRPGDTVQIDDKEFEYTG